MSSTQLLSWPQCVIQQASGLIMYSSINFEPFLVREPSISSTGFKFLYKARPAMQMLK